MSTLTSEMAAAMVRESMEQDGGPVEAHGLTYLPGAGFFVGSIGDMQSGARNVRIGEAYGAELDSLDPDDVAIMEANAEQGRSASERDAREALTALAGGDPRKLAVIDRVFAPSLDADDPALTLTTDDPPDALIEAAHAEALAENAARDAKALEAATLLGTAATDPALPKPPRKRKAPRE